MAAKSGVGSRTRTRRGRAGILLMMRALLLIVLAVPVFAQEGRWAKAHEAGPLTAEETRAFIRRLAEYVIANHVKRDDSPQRGMAYEYFDVAKREHVQGEALDTMHDGAWLAAAFAAAARATGDEFYRDALERWSLPFYCKMLNHSDTLFEGKTVHVRGDRVETWKGSKEWLLQPGEKGFVPYWWDDGKSMSLERAQTKRAEPDFPAYDAYLAKGEANPEFRLSGYSLGSSNHLAQDLGVMLQAGWLLFREEKTPRGERWRKEIAEAAKNLQQCRANHGASRIPAVVAPVALSSGDARLLASLPDPNGAKLWEPDNHYTRALAPAKAGQVTTAPGFADDQEYLYYAGIARAGGDLPQALAFKLIYDAYTQPMLYRYYCDDQVPPPGVGPFDLHPYKWVDGRPVDWRSDKKGPFGKARPIGSRFGPQNMVVMGWALQALKKYPPGPGHEEAPGAARPLSVWDERRERFAKDEHLFIDDAAAFPPADAWGLKDPLFMLGGIVPKHDGIGFSFWTTKEVDSFTVFTQPDAQLAEADERRSHATVTVRPAAGTASAVNDKGEALIVKTFPFKKDGNGYEVHVFLPGTVVKGQGAWGNVVEHGRYTFKSAERTFNFYVASRTKDVVAALERELGRGLATWRAVFDELGYVPTNIGEPRWQRFSDAGGYAHLIKAGSQWVNYLEGRRDWELQGVPGSGK